MTVTEEAPAPPPSVALPPSVAQPHRPGSRTGWRDLRFMLISVAMLLIAATVSVAIAYAVQGSSAPAGDVQASTIDYKVLLPTTLKTGKHTIGYTNNGTVPHEIVIFKTALSADNLPLNADGNINEDSPLLTNVADSGDALKAGGTKSFTTSSLAPGHYVAVCNLPGHYRLGMKLNVTVP
jgi:uncharacterized cupredoxin-like copper-binding protein